MATLQITGPYPIFTDLDGTPLDDGYLYIGDANDDPETNPQQVYWDANLTIPAAQPIRTSNGYAYRNGSPALIYTSGDFSITIRNKKNEFVLYSPVGYGFDPAAVSASVTKDDFVGDGVTTIFALSSTPSTSLATSVFINGVYQEKDSYTVAGNVLTFSVAPPLSSSIEVMTNETGVIGTTNANLVSYTAGFLGAVQQTVQSKLEQYVSVKDFGAVGDGVTDDTAAIQAAVDSGAKKIIGSGATYRCTNTISISAGVILDDMTLLYDGAVRQDFITVTADNVTFANGIVVDGNNKCLKGIRATACDNFLFDSATVRNLYSDGTIGLTGIDAWVVGIQVEGDCKNPQVINGKFSAINALWNGVASETDASTARAILFVTLGGNPSSIVCSNNEIRQVTGSSGVGVHLLASLGATYRDPMDYTVAENRIYGVTDRAFKIQASNGIVSDNKHFLGASELTAFFTTHSLVSISAFFNSRASVNVIQSENVSIVDNQFLAVGYDNSIIINDGSANVIVNDNVCVNNTAKLTAQNVITLATCVNCRVSDNNTRGGDYSVRILGASSGCVVEGGQAIDPAANGVRVEAGSNGNIIRNVVVSGSTTPTAAIGIEDSSNNVISGNGCTINNIPVVRIAAGVGTSPTGNVTQQNYVTHKGNVVTYSSAALAASNGENQNFRTPRVFEVTAFPPTFGKFDTGDLVRLKSGTTGDYIWYSCLFGGEYGTGTIPVFRKTGELVVV